MIVWCFPCIQILSEKKQSNSIVCIVSFNFENPDLKESYNIQDRLTGILTTTPTLKKNEELVTGKMEKDLLSEKIRNFTDTIGIDALGFADASEFSSYVLSNSRRRDPKLSLPTAKTIIVAGIYIGGGNPTSLGNPLVWSNEQALSFRVFP